MSDQCKFIKKYVTMESPSSGKSKHENQQQSVKLLLNKVEPKIPTVNKSTNFSEFLFKTNTSAVNFKKIKPFTIQSNLLRNPLADEKSITPVQKQKQEHQKPTKIVQNDQKSSIGRSKVKQYKYRNNFQTEIEKKNSNFGIFKKDDLRVKMMMKRQERGEQNGALKNVKQLKRNL